MNVNSEYSIPNLIRKFSSNLLYVFNDYEAVNFSASKCSFLFLSSVFIRLR